MVSNGPYQGIQIPSRHTNIPLRKKQEITMNYSLLIRSKEEIEMLKRDVENTTHFFSTKIEIMSKRVKEITCIIFF